MAVPGPNRLKATMKKPKVQIESAPPRIVPALSPAPFLVHSRVDRPTLTGAGGSDPFWHLALGYSWAGWSDYAARNAIVCDPGTVIKGGDGILYMCQ